MRADTVEWTRHALPRVLVVLVVAFVLIRLVRAATRRLDRFSKNITTGERVHQMHQLRTLAQVVNSVGVAVIFFLAAMQILPLLGLDIKPLLASAGIAGLAIGFGAQTLVKDVINGFFILLEYQYDIGDSIRIAGVRGNVEDMSLRRTVLRDDDGAVHIVPNSEIKLVSNMSRDWSQVLIRTTTAYTEPSDRITALLQQIGSTMAADSEYTSDFVVAPRVLGIDRVANGEADYLVVARTRPGRQFDVSRELRLRIKYAFEQNKIQTGPPGRVFV